mmetsp:Transcript_566/g.1483  ORF Transcript_566/g.1483 Transcript_566/m.1483 type:complete len:99 (+) Transcript_566:113-409(+)
MLRRQPRALGGEISAQTSAIAVRRSGDAEGRDARCELQDIAAEEAALLRDGARFAVPVLVCVCVCVYVEGSRLAKWAGARAARCVARGLSRGSTRCSA